MLGHFIALCDEVNRSKGNTIVLLGPQMQLLAETLQAEEAQRVGRQGAKRFPTSTGLWRQLLLLLCRTLSPASDVLDCLQQALTRVAPKVSRRQRK